MADGDRQVDIEVAVRDTSSQVLRGIAREVDNVTRKLIETGRIGSAAFDKIRDRAESSGVSFKRNRESVEGIDRAMEGLKKTLTGPLGIAALFLGTARAVGAGITHFATAQVGIKSMVTDLGLTEDMISKLNRVLVRKGVGSEEDRKAIITQLGEIGKNMQTYGFNSPKFRELQRYDRDLAKKVMEAAKSGQMDEVIKMLLEEFDTLGKDSRDRQQFYAREILGINASVLADMLKMLKEVKAGYKFDKEESEEFLRKREEVMNKNNEIMGKMAQGTAISVLYMMNVYKMAEQEALRMTQGGGGKTPGVGPASPGQSVPSGPPTSSDPRFNPNLFAPSPFAPKPGKQSSLQNNALMLASATRSDGGDDGDVDLPKKAIPVQFTKASLTLKDMEQDEKKSNESLQDIYKLLQELTNPMGVAGGGSGDTGGARVFRPGQPIPGGGARGPGTGRGPTVETPQGPNQFGISSPTPGGYIGRGLGARPSASPGGHQGRDWMVAEGTPVQAPDNIKVLRAGWFGKSAGYGIEFQDGQGVVHKYFHLREDPNKWVKPGREYGRGVRIGTVGTTGNAAGGAPHIHIETRRGGKVVDPAGIYWPGYGTGTNFVPPGQVRPAPSPAPATGAPTSSLDAIQKGWRTVRASTFDDRVTASGMPRTVPGIALPTRKALGQWFVVRDENTGKEVMVQQTDVGPFAKGRGIDINAPLASQFGYNKKNFPTDTRFSYRPALDSELAKMREEQRSKRAGKVSAMVDFKNYARRQLEGKESVFMPVKNSSWKQNSPPTGTSVLPGDTDYSRWVG